MVFGEPAIRVRKVSTISPHYFDTLKIPILRGRAFTARDGSEGEPVVVVSEAMARRYWPNDETFGDSLKGSLTLTDLPGHVWTFFHLILCHGFEGGVKHTWRLLVQHGPDEHGYIG